MLKSTAHLDTQDRKVIVLVSSDTEFDPPSGSEGWSSRSTKGLLEGLPRLLDLCDRHGISGTFFCEGKLVQALPSVFRDLAADHEIGCHSLAHEWLGVKPPPRWIPRRQELRILSMDAKKMILQHAVKCIGEVVGKNPRSFKAPFNSIDHPSTLRLLNQIGFDTDSSLPNHRESYGRPLWPAPCHHASKDDLWAEGDMHLVEVPFMIRLRPLLLHPLTSNEEVLDTLSRDLGLALESVEVQCRIDSLSGRQPTVVHVSSHPWEFSKLVPRSRGSGTNIDRLETYLDELSGRYNLEYLTIGEFHDAWEKKYCRLHSVG